MDKRVIEVVEYKSEWAAEFQKEAVLLEELLGNTAVEIHHIGSTSVPGLAAKDLIDIMVEVRSLEELDSFNAGMSELGYDVMGEYGITRRRFFMKGVGKRTHHVHAFPVGDPHVVRHLVFRDYLRSNSDVRTAYEDMKRRAAAECNDDIEIYCKIKDPFIKEHEKTALRLFG